MTLPTPLVFTGAPGSPYTRKMLALLRYRGIPYRFMLHRGRNNTDTPLPTPKVPLLPTFYLPGTDGALEAVVDSTPLIRRLESECSGHSVIPPHPVMNFLNYVLEDYADEWLTKAMFHYRWCYQADIAKAGDILPRWRIEPASEEEVHQMTKAFSERQTARLYVVGSNDTTAPIIESSYKRYLNIMKGHLQQHAFLFGNRPASADFAAYGQLTQLAQFDPTPMALTLDEAPRVYAWVDVVDDLSGMEPGDDDWMHPDSISEQQGVGLRELLCEIGRTYTPVMLANARALTDGLDMVETEVDGQRWQQRPFPYQGKCLRSLCAEYDALTTPMRTEVDNILSGTGCEQLLSR